MAEAAYKEAQRKTREALKPKDVTGEYPESRPQHMARTPKGFEMVNRKASRSGIGYGDPDTTKKRTLPERKVEKHPGPKKGQPQHSHRADKVRTNYRPDFDKLDNRPDLTNRQKNSIRRSQREIRKENERKQKELAKIRKEK